MHAIHRHQLENRSLAYSWSHEPHPRPLIILHGLGDSAIHTYAPRFSSTSLQSTPALFIDLPGFGEGSADATYASSIEAMADDVAHLIEHLGVQGAPIFAHSMGANIAISLTAMHPTVTQVMILAEPLLRPEESVLAAGIAKQSESAFVARGYEMLVRATSLQAHRDDKAAEAFLLSLRLANPIAMHRAATSLLRDQDPSFESRLLQIPTPVTLLTGALSNMTFSGAVRERLRIHRVPHSGHFMIAEAASETSYAILNLINGVHYGGIE